MVGRALEQLLRSAGYSARFLTEASLHETQALEGLELLLFAGGLDATRREAIMAVLREAAGQANLPVLELVFSLEASRGGAQGVLPWPCRVEELRERIEQTLLNAPHPRGKEANDG